MISMNAILTFAKKENTNLNAVYFPVLFQIFANLERKVVDDCSNDDSRITVLRTNKNVGTAATRKVGLRHAKSRYITFLDSDDLLDPNYLEKQLEFIKEHGPLISSGYRRKAKHT